MAVAAPVLMLLAMGAAAAATGVDPRLFRANDTLLGARVPCTDAEKLCFRYNRLLDEATGKCYRVGSRGPCLDGHFLLERNEFDARRRLVGACADPGHCPDHRFRMAYDGKCYTSKEVFGTFCDVRKGTSGWPYFFGGYECVCEGAGCPPARYVEQPSSPGECRFPNFRKDLTNRFFPRLPRRDLHCSLEHSRCFAEGMVSFATDDRCFKLLDQGPCPDGYLLVLDKQLAWRRQTVHTRCVPEERCPLGATLMGLPSWGYNQSCINETKIKNVMCPDLSTFVDVFGETVCKFQEEMYEVVLKSPREGSCSIRYNVQLTGVQDMPKPECTSSDPLDCLSLEEIDPDDILLKYLGDI